KCFLNYKNFFQNLRYDEIGGQVKGWHGCMKNREKDKTEILNLASEKNLVDSLTEMSEAASESVCTDRTKVQAFEVLYYTVDAMRKLVQTQRMQKRKWTEMGVRKRWNYE
ncbi:hypothetical protein L9F63_013430, partial [Diploptera punctata]